MNWFLVSMVSPLFWSVLNHADKYLISKYRNSIGVGGLAVFSSIFAATTLPFIYLLDNNVFSLSLKQSSFLTLTGVLVAFSVMMYLYALDKDDASHVVPFWFLIPIFTYIMGVFILGESISSLKMLASIVTILGALLLSIEFDYGVSFKKTTPILMVVSSLLLSFTDILFKKFYFETSFATSLFWNQFGMFIFGVFCLVFISSFRKDFFQTFKEKAKFIITLNVGGEVIQSLAIIINFYAMILAPVALVRMVNYTFQPLFVFLIGLHLTKFYPHISKEKINRKHVIQKITAIIVMSIGVSIILFA